MIKMFDFCLARDFCTNIAYSRKAKPPVTFKIDPVRMTKKIKKGRTTCSPNC